jgi:hypothetical protein
MLGGEGWGSRELLLLPPQVLSPISLPSPLLLSHTFLPLSQLLPLMLLKSAAVP